MRAERGSDEGFLWVDRLADADRGRAYARLRAGEIVTERLETRDLATRVEVPNGMIHHWVGTVLIPGASLAQTIAMVQDYDRYAHIYDPRIKASRLLHRDGPRFTVYLRLFMKKVVTIVLDTEYDIEFASLGDRRAFVPSYTTRVVEVGRGSGRNRKGGTAAFSGACTPIARSRSGAATP